MYKGKTKSRRGSNPKNASKGAAVSRKFKDKDKDKVGSESPTNDPKWYETTPDLLRDAASIPFSSASGTSYNLNMYGDGIAPVAERYVPGILTLSIIPTIGGDENFNSPLNIATNSLYGQVRKANSGAANYDAPNLFMYCMSVAQIYSYINYLMRIYGTAQLYVHYNRYVPEALLNAMGVDFSSIQENLADFRYGVNVLIHKASSFACPATLTYFNRLAFLFAGIYSEGDSIKDQLYMYVPAGFMQLTEQDTTPGWLLKYKPMPSPRSGKQYLTVSQLLEYGTQLITPLLQSEDFNIISGDILKAFGSNVLGLQSLPETYTILPVTDLAVLEQMQNADIVGGIWTAYDNTTFPKVCQIKENPNTNTLNAEFSITGSLTAPSDKGFSIKALQARCNANRLLTTILTQPTPADVIERTRLMFTANMESDESDNLKIMIQSGSDICVGATIWSINPATKAPSALPLIVDVGYLSTVQPGQGFKFITDHCALENFKFHPKLYYWEFTDVNNIGFIDFAVDIDNYALLSPQVITNMNEAALLALLNVPNVAGSFK